EVSPGATVQGYASYSVILSVDPYGGTGYATVGNLRRQLDRAAPGSLVGGPSAIQYDITQAAHRDTLLLIPLVLLVILIVVALLLRAVIAPVVLVATFAALIQQSQVTSTEVGTAVALGVLIDTLIVRTVLVPAALLTIGERVWWPHRLTRVRPTADDSARMPSVQEGAPAEGPP